MFATLQDPLYSTLVTELHVSLSRGTACLKRVESQLATRSGECTCDDHDADLGGTLSLLDNLKFLKVVCALCEDENRHHHNLVKKYAPRDFSLKCILKDGYPRRWSLSHSSVLY